MPELMDMPTAPNTDIITAVYGTDFVISITIESPGQADRTVTYDPASEHLTALRLIIDPDTWEWSLYWLTSDDLLIHHATSINYGSTWITIL